VTTWWKDCFAVCAFRSRRGVNAGDLVEEREQRGWASRWPHVVGLAFVLWRNATMDAPLRMLTLTRPPSAPAFAGAAAVLLFPPAIGSLPSRLALAFISCGGALWLGASLAIMAPRQGMATLALVAAVGVALLVVVGGDSGSARAVPPIESHVLCRRGRNLRLSLADSDLASPRPSRQTLWPSK
jgi:hypothetical protein